MGILSWIVFGLIAGALAKLIMPGDDPGGIFVTILIGVAGAFLGGMIASLVGVGTASMSDFSFSLGSFLTAIVGALVLLFAYRQFKKRT